MSLLKRWPHVSGELLVIKGWGEYQGFRLSTGKFLYLLNSYSRTFRNGCPVQLVLCASEYGNVLIVKKFIEDHNHILSMVCTLLAGYILARNM